MGNSAAPAAPAQLRASALAWRRLRRIAMALGLTAAAIGGWHYFLQGAGLFLSADGLAMRDHMSVSAPYDARIKQVLVHPGDRVEKGQTIAIVESASISRTLAELSAERARIGGRIAQIEARRKVIDQLLPFAEDSAKQTRTFQDELVKAGTKGMTVFRSLQEISAANVTAQERVLSLKAEREALHSELTANTKALDETNLAYADLQRIYDGGILRAPVSGYVGSDVAYEGEVLVPGKARLTQIYTGKSFVLAFMPEAYLFDVESGDSVVVSARGKSATGTIEKVLPVTDALPPEFQIPGKARNRGQVVRIALHDPDQFAVEEKVRINGCLTNACKVSLSSFVRAFFHEAWTIATQSKSATERLSTTQATEVERSAEPPRRHSRRFDRGHHALPVSAADRGPLRLNML